MKLDLKVILFLIILLLSAVLVSAQTRVIQSKPGIIRTMIKVELQSQAKYYVGVCPVEVKMTGKITASAPVTVKYRFEKSEGGMVKLQTLRLAKGVNTLPFKWKLNKNGQYWVKLLVVLSGKEHWSDLQTFEVKCDPSERKKILKQLAVPQKKISLEQIGPVKLINPKPVVQQSNDKISEIPKVADLVVSWIYIDPQPGKTYNNIKFIVTIKNISSYRTEHSKSCYLRIVFRHKNSNPYNPGYIYSDPYFYVIPEISSGSYVNLEVYFKFYNINRYTIIACADAKKTVNEINEENNCKWRYVTILK